MINTKKFNYSVSDCVYTGGVLSYASCDTDDSVSQEPFVSHVLDTFHHLPVYHFPQPTLRARSSSVVHWL